MEFLSKIAEADRELVVSLFYKVGAFVAHCQKEEGGKAKPLDKLERRELLFLFQEMAADFTQPFVKEVAAEAFVTQIKWSDWRQNMDQLIPECEKVISLLEGTLGERYVKNYRLALYGIGQAMARACHRNQVTPSFCDVFVPATLFRKLSICFKNHLRGCESYDVNISLEEKKALKTLKEVLQL